MTGLEITCANKDQHGAILRIGGDGWSMSIHDAITKLLARELRAYVRSGNTFAAVGLRGDGADAYLALEPDGVPLHDLTSLPSC
jgi:hypothetical protein